MAPTTFTLIIHDDGSSPQTTVAHYQVPEVFAAGVRLTRWEIAGSLTFEPVELGALEVLPGSFYMGLQIVDHGSPPDDLLLAGEFDSAPFLTAHNLVPSPGLLYEQNGTFPGSVIDRYPAYETRYMQQVFAAESDVWFTVSTIGLTPQPGFRMFGSVRLWVL